PHLTPQSGCRSLRSQSGKSAEYGRSSPTMMMKPENAERRRSGLTRSDAAFSFKEHAHLLPASSSSVMHRTRVHYNER
ncbi:hypothetical protein BaRGS_00010127, partial [Batillaria attramentaria]